MANVGIIGLDPQEVQSLKLVVALLRHCDPMVREVTRQALHYLDVRYLHYTGDTGDTGDMDETQDTAERVHRSLVAS